MLLQGIEVVTTRLKRQGTMTIMIEVPFETICSVPKKPYGGTINVTYTPILDKDGIATLLEWNSFAKWIEGLRNQEFLAEELAQAVLQAIYELVPTETLLVSLTVNSAFHLPVVVEVSIP